MPPLIASLCRSLGRYPERYGEGEEGGLVLEYSSSWIVIIIQLLESPIPLSQKNVTKNVTKKRFLLVTKTMVAKIWSVGARALAGDCHNFNYV